MTDEALASQVGGSHYAKLPIQPAEFIHRNGIGFLEGNVIKYVVRHRAKNGIEDLKKARHYIDILIELAYPGVATNGDTPPDHKHNSTRETTYPDNTCDLSPLGAALLGRTCEDCES